MLIQRWTIGKGGFIGEVSLQQLSEWDLYVRGRDQRAYCELTNLYVHPLRRGQGWARILMETALQHAQARDWPVFLRCVPYGIEPSDLQRLMAFYRSYGFKSTRRDPREMVLKWPTITKAK